MSQLGNPGSLATAPNLKFCIPRQARSCCSTYVPSTAQWDVVADAATSLWPTALLETSESWIQVHLFYFLGSIMTTTLLTPNNYRGQYPPHQPLLRERVLNARIEIQETYIPTRKILDSWGHQLCRRTPKRLTSRHTLPQLLP